MRLLGVVSLILFCILQGFAVQARGKQKQMTLKIHLAVEAGHQPDYLCVVSYGEPALPRVPVCKPSERKEALPATVGNNDECPGNVQSFHMLASDKKNDDGSDAKVREIENAIRIAQQSLTQAEDTPYDGACDAKVEPFDLHEMVDARKAFMTCVENAADRDAVEGKGYRRVAIVEVLAYRSALGTLQLDGDIATLHYPESAAEDAFPVTARVLGGHYLAGVSEMRINGRIDLSLIPRCYTRRVESPARLREHKVAYELMQSGGPPASLPEKWIDDGVVLLPHQRHGEQRLLRLSIEKDNRHAAYVSLWETSSPPRSLAFRPAEVYFGWRVSPNFPVSIINDDTCPTASIPAIGLTCEAHYRADDTHPGLPAFAEETDHRGTCYYNCAANNEIPKGFDYPQTVRFVVEDLEDAWEETLSNVGQIYRGYADADDRHMIVDFSGYEWCYERCTEKQDCDTSRIVQRGDRVHTVMLKTSDGRVYRIPARPTDSHRIVLPGAGHGDLVTYCIEGDREYYCNDTHISHGRISITSPNSDAKKVSFSLNIGGGFAMPFTFRESGIPAKPYANAEIAMKFHPIFPPPLAFELHATYLLSKQSYHPMKTPTSASVDGFSSIAYNRFLFGLRIVLLTNSRFRLAFSPGLGLGVGYPLWEDDIDKVGSAYLFWVLAEGHLRYSLNRKRTWFIEVNSRVLAFENLFRYEMRDERYLRTPVRKRDNIYSIHLGIGLRGWLW